MNFDDRLATVLRFRAGSPATMRIQYRQLLDLLGTMPADLNGGQVDEAMTRLAELARTIPAPERAAMIGEPSLRIRSPRLVALLAGAEPELGAIAVSRAELNDSEWLDLVPALDRSARSAMRERRDLGSAVSEVLDRLGVQRAALPSQALSSQAEPAVAEPAEAAILAPQPAPQPISHAATDAGIGAIVKRIEAYRKARGPVDPIPAPGDAPRLPLDDDRATDLPPPAAFDFASDTAGRVTWTDPGVAPMVVGTTLDGGDDRVLATAMRRRQPLRALEVRLDGAPAIAGAWQIDAVPVFDPGTGSFTGYRGRFRRPCASPALQTAARGGEADRIRMLLHELRTPVNAIQGFAEVIQQQLFGPTPHEYRALAATIAGDAARMLAAFEELERLAKLESGALSLDPGQCDLAAVIRDTAARLEAHSARRGSGFALRSDAPHYSVAVARIEAERIAWRLLATLIGATLPGEVLALRLRDKGAGVRVSIELPAALAALGDEELFTASVGSVPQVIAAGMFGVGFALRLVRAEAEASGGRLRRKGDRLRLDLPVLAPPQAAPVHESGAAPA